MVSKSFCVSVFLVILRCRFAVSVDERGPIDSKQNGEFPVISLSAIGAAFRNERVNDVEDTLRVMLWAASYGDRVYNLAVNVSFECSTTAKAHWLLVENLAVGEEAFHLMQTAVNVLAVGLNHLSSSAELKEHPLEIVCRSMESWYRQMPNLSPLFEKAKKDAAKLEYVSRRPPYYRGYKTGREKPMDKLIEMCDVPELAKLNAHYSFAQLIDRNVDSRVKRTRPYLFAKACQAVAAEGQFADALQTKFEQAIVEVLPEIMAEDRVKKFRTYVLNSGDKDPWYYWVNDMLRKFYRNISMDQILKKKVDVMGSFIGKDFSEEDLDFSKI